MLKDAAVRSAQIYLDYLTAHREEGLGLVRANVRGMQGFLLDGDVILLTDRPLRSGDGIVIRIGGVLYDNSQNRDLYNIMSVNRRAVRMQLSPELAEKMDIAWEEKTPIVLEIDLTFLVKRVKNWYEKYGDRVELPAVKPACRLDPDNPIALSDNQYSCAELAMASPLSYIWGAPGTGKTKHVLASCVLSYIRAGKKVILVAPTNNALEQSLFGLLGSLSGEGGINPAGTVIRLGVPGDAFQSAWPDVCEKPAEVWKKEEINRRADSVRDEISLLEQSIAVREGSREADDPFPEKDIRELQTEKQRKTAEYNHLLNLSRKLLEYGIMAVISDFSVVAATVDTCLFKMAPAGAFRPDHIFLDEAGYCNVIKGMTLLGFGKPLTLLGDHMQLPPVAEGERDLFRDPQKKLSRLWKISSLYMENVIISDEPEAFCEKEPDRPRFNRTQVGALVETHRFGPELAQLLAKRVYGPRFCSCSENETQIVYINAPKKPDDKLDTEEWKKQRISHSEAKAIRAFMESNLRHPGVTIGIITPYRRQRRLLAETMYRLFARYGIEDEDMDDDIVTVHQSQGREWDIVLFSLTDCFEEMHFTNSLNRESLKLINTAVSRARKMLILVGDADNWKGKPGQLISELFAVGKEIPERERVAEKLCPDREPPWMGNYGSLFMAPGLDE